MHDRLSGHFRANQGARITYTGAGGNSMSSLPRFPDCPQIRLSAAASSQPGVEFGAVIGRLIRPPQRHRGRLIRPPQLVYTLRAVIVPEACESTV